MTFLQHQDSYHNRETKMYVTRPLSLYRKYPNFLSLPPLEGPNSGYLVIKDEESIDTCCFGLCEDTKIRDFPFPQNKILSFRYESGVGENRYVSTDDVLLIPVLGQPLSSNQYYVIKAEGRHKGEAHTCSREEDMVNCCFCNCISDVKPRALDDPHDIYQQVEFVPRKHLKGFHAKSVAPDGFLPSFLRRKGWEIIAKNPRHNYLDEAQGIDAPLRSRLPQFDFPISDKHSRPVVVGKWYCPFMFVKDMERLKDQFKKSMFYQMTLEQRWEEIYTCDNRSNEGNVIVVDVWVERETLLIFDRKALKDETVIDGVVWFRVLENNVGGDLSVGLSSAIVERMMWEQERGGWFGGGERQVRVERVEEFGGKGGWSKFGCYVLIERFALRRMDGSLVLACDFKHTHQIQCKWE